MCFGQVKRYSLKFGFYETESTGVLRVTHRNIHIHEVILEPNAIEIRFSSSDPDDKLLKRYGEIHGTTFAWRVQLAGLIETDSLQICSEGREFVMRKQEGGQWGRLSSSATAIRSSNYSTPRNYGPSLSSYRYSASSYTPSTRPPPPPSANAGPTPEPSYASGSMTLTRSSTSAASTGSALTRSSSVSPGYQRSLYTTPAAARSAAFSPSTFASGQGGQSYAAAATGARSYGPSMGHSPSSYSLSSAASGPPVAAGGGTAPQATATNNSPPTAVRSRSSSAIASYRSVNVAQLNQQARERAERDEKAREYKEWEERERIRSEMEEAPIADFRKKYTGARSYGPSMGHSPSSYSLSSAASGPPVAAGGGTAPQATATNNSPPTAVRSRSSSAIASYRSVNLTQLNQQARERAERDEKAREYKEWEERERIRSEMEEAPIADFRKKYTGRSSTGTTMSPGYAQFSKAVTSRSELGAATLTRPDYPGNSAGAVPPAPADPPRYTSSYTGYKPTATVQPFEDRGVATVQPGFTGLRNIGNTCFMNATLQMLVNNIELKTYFLERHYKLDVNPNNPLGFRGRLADAFADFMRHMWNCQNRAIEPAKIKELVAEKASQFANFAQHDAHEFLSFLLDGLHEDLNRVSNEAWYNHTLRNDSIFVDLFHGQLKSRLQCPKCDRVSITFDPFVYLPVPFPKVKKTTTLYFWPIDPLLKPLEITVQYSSEGTIQDLLGALSEVVRVPTKALRLVEVFSHRIQKIFSPSDKASEICSGDVLYAFQVHDAADCNEPVIELLVVQRQLYSSTLRYACNECGRSTGRLKACEACYNAYYCNKECQLANWNTGGHRDECRRRTTADYVGQPFMVSLPRSQLTYQHLIRVLEARCRFSVDIFQPPQLSNSSEENEASVREGSDGSNPEEKKVGAPPMLHRASASHSPSPSTAGSTPRRQTVMPEQRKKPEFKMFLVRKLADQAHVLGDTIVDDKTEWIPGEPLELESGTYLSINWYNLRNGRPFMSVENRRALQIDNERSEQLAKQLRKFTSGGSCGDPTLQDMLGMFSETERLKPEESWYCNKCRDHVEATKKLELFRLPPVLIVQLKRFVYTATYQTMHRRSKDERRVIYPIGNLDMSPFLAETAPAGQNTVYDLTGVVCHSGSSYFGHYVSIGRLAGFDSTETVVDWRLFDDSIVSKQSVNNVQSDDAYLLFYKQRGVPTKSIFRTKSSSLQEIPVVEKVHKFLNIFYKAATWESLVHNRVVSLVLHLRAELHMKL
ncbi:MYND finger [Ancylostoma ceylanicum]|uniref:ubiquitinyl hydrolase 1 n=1 Tax=Ancylostoma ceylanicum TaxID=53326 RepID=A0A0D6M1Y5_9BILA|nr:MYND finger [Ancylostoma ceylanicum]